MVRPFPMYYKYFFIYNFFFNIIPRHPVFPDDIHIWLRVSQDFIFVEHEYIYAAVSSTFV
jgi:hypothetical protein